MPKYTSQSEKETLRRLSIECRNLAQIGEHLGISAPAAKARLQRIGLPTPRGAQFRERKRLFLELFNARVPLKEIATRLGISMVSARARLRDHGLSAFSLPGCKKILKNNPDYSVWVLYQRFVNAAGSRKLHPVKDVVLDKRLSYEVFKGLVIRPCAYCKQPPVSRTIAGNIGHKDRSRLSVIAHGIDRVDSDKGYFLGNVLPCCSQCNYAKNDYSLEEFCEWFNRGRKEEFLLSPTKIQEAASKLAQELSAL